MHEAGHVIIAHSQPRADPLHKVTIVPRGRTLGATHQLPGEDRHTLAESYLRDRLAVLMGGRTAEREILGEVSSGTDDDIRQATAPARAMVSRWGMSSEVGPMDVRDAEEHPFLGREIAQPRHASEETARAVDNAVRKLLHEAETIAAKIIRANRPGMDRLVAALEERESLDHAEVAQCVGATHIDRRGEQRNFA